MSLAYGFGLPHWQPLSGGFNPSSLFTGGEQGAWYDPSDLTTLFQGSAGTTPVTAVEQPVGLMLDKSQGLVLGPELITDAADRTFTSDTGWWTKNGSATIGSGKCTLTTGSSIQRLNLTTSGRWYVIEYDLTVRSGALYIQSYFSSTNSSTSGHKKFYIYSTTSTFRPIVDSGDVDITNITIKELPGNHAYQTTSTSRPTLRARYNLLTYSEEFNNAAWTKGANITVTANAVAAPDGSTTADLVVSSANADSSLNQVFQQATVGSSATYTASLWVSAAGANQDIVIRQTENAVLVANTTVSVTSTWQRITVTFTAATNPGFAIRPDGVSNLNVYIWGAQLTQTAVFPSNTYQRIAAATDYATGAAFPPYLFFDGVDDSLLTNSINFSATDKMSVCAGVTKLSDAATSVVTELSATSGSNSGVFVLFAPGSPASKRFGFNSNGNAGAVAEAATTDTAYNAPFTAVLTGQGNISGDSVTLRANATQVGSSTADQGAGNYGNWPLYIGRRNNATLPLNGNVYSLIIRGAQSTAAQISSTESWVAAKTPLGSL